MDSKPYSTPGQLRKAASRLRHLGASSALNSSERELVLKSADVLEALGNGHDVVYKTMVTLEPK